MSGIILIIIIVLTSMVIAYIGDVLGKRIGKKRISIFGLRPKHTAIVITVITGAVISVGTFGVLISLSAPMRRMLLRTEEIYRDMKTAESARNTLEEQNRGLKRDAAIISDQLVNIQNERTKLEDEIVSMQTQIKSAKEEISQRETQLDILANNLANLDSKLTESGRNLASATSELEKTKSDKLVVENAIASLKQDVENLESDIKSKENKITGLNDEINRKSAEIEKIRTSELAFYEGQRLYGFTIGNSLSSKEILDAIDTSFADFKNQKERNLNCTIEKPDPKELYGVLEKIDSSKAEKSIILVFSRKNCFQGDEIPVSFMVLDQYLVFKTDRVIVEERIDRKMDVLEVLGLVGNLILQAEKKAGDLGLMSDPYRRMSTFGPELLKSEARRIENHRRPMVVRLVAKNDIYRSDYLDENNLKFEIIDG